jgi:hypothetical protein
METGRVVAAVAVFLVLGLMAVLMGRSAAGDWREGRSERDRATQFYALQQWWPTLLAALGAVAVPIAILATN